MKKIAALVAAALFAGAAVFSYAADTKKKDPAVQQGQAQKDGRADPSGAAAGGAVEQGKAQKDGRADPSGAKSGGAAQAGGASNAPGRTDNK